jgi:hypothetical protein
VLEAYGSGSAPPDSAHAIVAINLKKGFGDEGYENPCCDGRAAQARTAARAQGEQWVPKKVWTNVAVHNVTVGIRKESLFCLLGHNV